MAKLHRKAVHKSGKRAPYPSANVQDAGAGLGDVAQETEPAPPTPPAIPCPVAFRGIADAFRAELRRPRGSIITDAELIAQFVRACTTDPAQQALLAAYLTA